MKKMKLLLLMGLIFSFLLPQEAVFADEADESTNYSVQPILPENQLDRGRTFFDLRVKPGEKQTIQIQINNFSNQAETFAVKVNTAQTNGNMIIDYGKTELPTDSSNEYSISSLAEYPEEVEIPAQKAGKVSIELTVPETEFDGILLGGIEVKKDFSKEKAESEDTLFSEYAYVIGLMLSENDAEVVPDLKFVSIDPSNISNNAGLVATLENAAKINIKDATLTAEIYSESKKEPVITKEITGGGIAPESVFGINLFNGEAGNTAPLEAGNYQAEIKVTDSAGHEWLFTESFVITAKAAKEINRQVFTVVDDSNPLLYGAIGGLAAVILSLAGYIFMTKKKEKQAAPTEETT